jgi:hypothetical protein
VEFRRPAPQCWSQFTCSRLAYVAQRVPPPMKTLMSKWELKRAGLMDHGITCIDIPLHTPGSASIVPSPSLLSFMAFFGLPKCLTSCTRGHRACRLPPPIGRPGRPGFRIWNGRVAPDPKRQPPMTHISETVLRLARWQGSLG